MAVGFRYFIERKLALKIEIPRSNVIIHLSNKGLWIASSTVPYLFALLGLFWFYWRSVCCMCLRRTHIMYRKLEVGGQMSSLKLFDIQV